MTRKLRVQIPRGIYQVFAHGVDDRPVFRTRADRERFLWILADVLERHGWHCLAFCQMTTHYHLLLETLLPDLAAGMKRLNQCYAQSFNKQHGRRGHLFESRYGSVLVRDQAQLLTEYAYLMLNPVEAGICDDPLDWEWCSHRQTVGDGGFGIVSTQRMLRLAGRTPAEAARRLDVLVAERLPAARRHTFS